MLQAVPSMSMLANHAVCVWEELMDFLYQCENFKNYFTEYKVYTICIIYFRSGEISKLFFVGKLFFFTD